MNYKIDYDSWFQEGGYCQFYPIKDHPHLGFKEFRSQRHAKYAYKIQSQLSLYDLAPMIHSDICRLSFYDKTDNWTPEISDWGYVTEIAKEIKYTSKTSTLKEIQALVDNIFQTTNLKFWDCHFSNIGLIKRLGKLKLVCIDTGKESFDGYSNAWGFANPGPKCCYCNKYQCKCPEDE